MGCPEAGGAGPTSGQGRHRSLGLCGTLADLPESGKRFCRPATVSAGTRLFFSFLSFFSILGCQLFWGRIQAKNWTLVIVGMMSVCRELGAGPGSGLSKPLSFLPHLDFRSVTQRMAAVMPTITRVPRGWLGNSRLRLGLI